MATQQNIRHLSLSELETYFTTIGQPMFRVKQVHEWLWQKHAHSFDDMTNLSKDLRTKLAAEFTLPALKIETVQNSEDGTIKSRFKTSDNHFVEGVLIPTEARKTACVSSQIGCSLSCKFCATGYMERKRNLNYDEIYDQVVMINQQSEATFNKKLSNIVFMGMGEPLLNYKNVLKSIERISADDGLGMSPKRITVSTAGVASQIKHLGDDKVKFNLAVSLHAAKASNALLVDQKITFHIKINASVVSAVDDHIVQLVSPYPSPQLVSLSIQSGSHSRYKIDPGFKNNEFDYGKVLKFIGADSDHYSLLVFMFSVIIIITFISLISRRKI